MTRIFNVQAQAFLVTPAGAHIVYDRYGKM